MAKELMEIGGFITEGAEIVNHDNTLSGNGTVDSPLGVVPGYNETVLFEGTPQNSGTVQLSESIGNFDRVLLYWTKTVDNNNAGNVDIISTVRAVYNFMHHIGSANAWIQLARLDYNDTARQLTFTAGKNLNFGAYSATTWANPSVSSGIGDSFYLYKVVGNNRIANNSAGLKWKTY